MSEILTGCLNLKHSTLYLGRLKDLPHDLDSLSGSIDSLSPAPLPDPSSASTQTNGWTLTAEDTLNFTNTYFHWRTPQLPPPLGHFQF